MTSGPNPVGVLWSILKARRTRRPRPTGDEALDHSRLTPILTAVAGGGVGALETEPIARYLAEMAEVDPDRLDTDEALAYWLNVYNAGALELARRAFDQGAGTVLRIPGGFSSPLIDVAGERLSLDDVEHGKIRRFGDPRIHAALVCGSASCPTLRFEPYHGSRLDTQLDDQMRHFLASGAAQASFEAGTIALSRVLWWYGADFVRPGRMPTIVPARRRRVLHALERWLDPEVARWAEQRRPSIEFQDYDWGLGCAVRLATTPHPRTHEEHRS